MDMPGTGLSKNLISPIAIARVFGESINADRIQLFKSFYESLTKIEDPNYTDGNGNIKSYRNFSFFEGYFSNCIEGTESTIEESKQIIISATPLPATDEDSHEVLGTYQIISNRNEMSL